MGFFRNVSGTIGAKLAIIIFGFLSGMITARWLGPNGRGLLALVTSIPPTIWMLSSFGINQASVYYINKKAYPLKKIIGICFIIPLVLGTIIALSIWFSRHGLILKAFPYLNDFFLLVALIPLPFLLVQNSFVGVLRAVDKFAIINIRQIVRAGLGLLAGSVVLILLDRGISNLLVCFLALDIVIALWMVLEVHRICKIRPYFEKKIAKDMISFGLKSYVQNMIGFLHNRLDMYMIAYFLVPAQIAYYDIAVVLGELLLFLPQSITFVILPDLVRGTEEEKAKSVAKVARVSLFIALVMALGLVTLGYYLIIFVYGNDFAESYIVLCLLLPGLVISSMNGVTVPYYTSMARQKITIICSILSLLLNAGLNLYAIPTYGAYGAAATTSITYSAFSFMLLTVFVREQDVHYSEILVIRKEDFMAFYEKLKQYRMKN